MKIKADIILSHRKKIAITKSSLFSLYLASLHDELYNNIIAFFTQINIKLSRQPSRSIFERQYLFLLKTANNK